ncbi:MAG: hypothetical protein ABI543_00395 [Ignavibacteria bacterium]
MTKRKIYISQVSTIALIILVKFSFVILFSSCGAKEKLEKLSDKKESNSKNESKSVDAPRYYYPVTTTDKDNSASSIDTAKLSTYSGTLLKAKEPIIYSISEGHDVYRLMQFNGFDKCTIVSLHKDKDNIWLTCRILSRAAFLKPQSNGKYVPAINPDGSLDTTKEISYAEYESMSDMPVKLEFIKNITGSAENTNWEELGNLIKDSGFFEMPSYLNEKPDKSKMSFSILEARINNKYWIVERNNADGNFKKCCDYLLGLNTK